MIITTSNYYDCAKNIDWSAVPASLKKTHETLIPDAAKGDWQAFRSDDDVRRVVEKYFGYIGKYTTVTAPPSESSKPKPERKPTKANAAAVKAQKKRSLTDLPQPTQVVHIPTSTAFIKRYVALHGKVKKQDQILSLIHGLQKAITEQRIKTGSPALREIEKMQSELIALATAMGDSAKIEIDTASFTHYKQIAQGEEVRTSVKLLKQFIQMNGKAPDKTKAENLGKKMAAAFDTIPKEDIYRSELAAGAKAVANYVGGSSKTVGIPEASLHGLSGLAGLGSVAGLGRITGGNAIISLLQDAKVKDLTEASLKRAFRNAAAPGLCLELAGLMMRRGELSMDILKEMTVKQRPTVLAGIEGSDITDLDILDWKLAGSRSGIQGLAGLGQAEATAQLIPVPLQPHPSLKPAETISAKELAQMRFKTIGYNGRFKDVVGDPAVGFHMMVYGKPFQGKSSFVIELCKDLAVLGKGRIAYLALEEGISASMQKKVIDRGADKLDRLDFIGTMPTSFKGYSFIVIDSVSDRSIKREKLRELFLQNPQTCFICIFHATKAGSARGGLDYSHDMDIILRIDAHKPLVEKNRFL